MTVTKWIRSRMSTSLKLRNRILLTMSRLVRMTTTKVSGPRLTPAISRSTPTQTKPATTAAAGGHGSPWK